MSFATFSVSYGSQKAESSEGSTNGNSTVELTGNYSAKSSWWKRKRQCQDWRKVTLSAVFLVLVLASVSVAVAFATSGHGKNSAEASGSDNVENLGTAQKASNGPLSAFLMMPSADDPNSYSRLTRNIPRQSNRNRVTPRTSSSSANYSVNGTTAERQNQTDQQSSNTTNPISLLNEKEHRFHPRYEFEHCTLHRKKVAVQSFWSKVYVPRINDTFGPAYGRNKKEAKRRVAEIALTQLYNITYPIEVDPLSLRHEEACRENS